MKGINNMKKLIINADDFGYTPGVTAGIIEAHKRGIVTSTTALVVSPYFMEAMDMARLFVPTLAIGLHLTLTLRHAKPILPVHEVPSLVDDKGEFLNVNAIIAGAKVEEIEKEWEAQLLKFFESGERPDHLDSHHNIHGGSEQILAVALKLAKKYNLPLRNCERQSAQIGLVKKAYGQTRTPDEMKAEFYDKNTTMEILEQIFQEIAASDKEIFEMNCHPAFIDYQLEEWSSYCHQRVNELKILTSEKVKKMLADNGILLANYEILRT